MPIEFRCSQCMKLLRVGDDAVGKQAKCPACGSLATVPSSLVEAPPSGAPGLPPSVPSSAGNPFAAGGFAPPPLAPPSDNPYAAPLTGGESMAGTLRPTRITVNAVLEDAWAVFKDNFWMLVAVHFVEWIIGQFYSNGGSVVLGGILGGMQGGGGGGDLVVVVMFQIVFVLGSVLLSVWLASGRDLYFIQAAKNQSPQFSTLFGGHVILGKRLGLTLVYLLTVAVLAAPPVVIGIIVAQAAGDEDAGLIAGVSLGAVSMIILILLMLIFAQAWFVVLDQQVTVMESLRVSRRITEGNRLMLFALQILVGLVAMAGVCACFIGIFATVPLAYMMAVVAYMQMTGQPVAGAGYNFPPRERALPAQPSY